METKTLHTPNVYHHTDNSEVPIYHTKAGKPNNDTTKLINASHTNCKASITIQHNKENAMNSSKPSLYTIHENNHVDAPFAFQTKDLNKEKTMAKHKRTKSDQIVENVAPLHSKFSLLKNNYISGIPKSEIKLSNNTTLSSAKKISDFISEKKKASAACTCDNSEIINENKESIIHISKKVSIPKKINKKMHQRSSSDGYAFAANKFLVNKPNIKLEEHKQSVNTNRKEIATINVSNRQTEPVPQQNIEIKRPQSTQLKDYVAKSVKKEKPIPAKKEAASFVNIITTGKSTKQINRTKISEKVSFYMKKENKESISKLNASKEYYSDVKKAKQYESTPATKLNSIHQSPKSAVHMFIPIEEVSQQKEEIASVVKTINGKFDYIARSLTTTTDMYKVGKLLGKGAFGKVHLGVHKLTGKLIAIKSVKKEFLNDQHSKKKVMQEFAILMQLNHESVITLYETFESTKHILFVIELCSGGDLLNYVRKRRKLKENYAKYIFKQIIEGLSHCHQHNILHRDIKLDNILINGKGRIKICDFGVSKVVNPGEKMHEQCGTPAYIAPEILKGEGYDGFVSDIWSAGVMLYAMLYGTVPFKANSMHDLHILVMKGKYHLKDEISEDAKSMLTQMLEVNPKKRITISGILKHPWMSNIEPYLEMFTNNEKLTISKEYDYKNKNRDESEREFTEQNIDSTMNELLHNASTKSMILAPFNSTIHGSTNSSSNIPILKKKDVLKLKGKVKDIDRQYEKNNNCELDNGVCNKFLQSNSSGSKNSLGDSFNNDSSVVKENSQLLHSLINSESSEVVAPVRKPSTPTIDTIGMTITQTVRK